MSGPAAGVHTIAPIRDELGVRPGLLWIGGEWREAVGGEVLEVVHPATAEPITTVPRGGAADVDAAVAAARAAFERWGRADPRARRRVLQRAAELVSTRARELNRLQSLDTGMPVIYSELYQVGAAFLADALDYYAGWTDKLTGDTIPLYRGRAFDLTIREPVGVCAAIIPWNAPLVLCGLKLAPALAAGNTVVLKPSELAPLVPLRLAELLAEAGLPPGVVNVVTGTGPEAGVPLVGHPGVDKVSFTGGRDTGSEVMRRAAGTLKRVTLELGGKSPVIVFPDAPSLELAAQNAVGSVAFGLSGQGCACVTRALVHAEVYERFLEAAGRALDAVRQGFPFDETVNAGPLISGRQRQRVLAYVEAGLREGAVLLRGGKAVEGPGYFVEPALFAEVRPEMTVAQEEIFGPVLCVQRFASAEEAVELANATTYGLAGQVWTTDLRTAFQVLRGLRAGTVGVNGYEVVPTAPFGGVRRSGFGREGGREALDDYTVVKNVFFDLSR